MRIERINEYSVALTIDSNELKDRNLKLADLSYGSEKSKELLIEIINMAKKELNFVVDAPIAVEAVPLKDGDVKLIVTKIIDPDELDARFSRFTPMKNDLVPLTIMQLLESTIDKFEDAIKINSTPGVSEVNTIDKLEIHGDRETICIFEFDEIDKASDACKNVSIGEWTSVFYKDEKNLKFYLALSINSNLPKEKLTEFNKTCNTLAEYGNKIEGRIGMNKAYYDEHYKIIIKENAVQKLSML